MNLCVVKSCRNKPSKGKRKHYFRFPKDPIQLAKWLKAVKSTGLKNFVPTGGSRLCSDHFTDKDFVVSKNTHVAHLRENVVPSRFTFNSTSTKPNNHEPSKPQGITIKNTNKKPPTKATKLNKTVTRTSSSRKPILQTNSPKNISAKTKFASQPSTLIKSHKYPTRNTTVIKIPLFNRDKGKKVNKKPRLSASWTSGTAAKKRRQVRSKLKPKVEVPVKEIKKEKPDPDMEEYTFNLHDASKYDEMDKDSIEAIQDYTEEEEDSGREVWSKQDDMLEDLDAATLDPELLYKKLQKYRGSIPALDVLIKMNRNLSAENEALRRRLTDVESRLDLWSVDKIAHDDVATRCYTGLPTYSAFLWLFTTLQPKVQSINLEDDYVTESEDELEKSDDMDTEELPFIDQLLLVMMRLKVGLLIPDLASRFGIRNAQARSIFSIWINAMEYVFRENYPLLPKHLMKLHTPADFRNYSSTRLILASICVKAFLGFTITAKDCQKYPSRLKFLLGIMPNGVVCFVSQPFAEQSREAAMVQNSGVLDLLQEGDCVMGYGWPEIKDVFLKNNISYIPFPKREDEGLGELLRISYSVEDRLKLLKTFNILSESVPLSRMEKLGKIFTVCAFLINLIRTP